MARHKHETIYCHTCPVRKQVEFAKITCSSGCTSPQTVSRSCKCVNSRLSYNSLISKVGK